MGLLRRRKGVRTQAFINVCFLYSLLSVEFDLWGYLSACDPRVTCSLSSLCRNKMISKQSPVCSAKVNICPVTLTHCQTVFSPRSGLFKSVIFCEVPDNSVYPSLSPVCSALHRTYLRLNCSIKPHQRLSRTHSSSKFTTLSQSCVWSQFTGCKD